MVSFIESRLYSAGFGCLRIPSPDGSKASLLASVGPADRPGLVLSAHTDVVPVDGQDWKTPPFHPTLTAGRIHGRGATDMKGFIAVLLAHAPALAAACREVPVTIALSYDEELGCRGAPDLVTAVAAGPVRPALCIVGEPTGMRVAVAHKGKFAERLHVWGRGGHSAFPHRAASALMSAAALAVSLDELGHALARERRDPDFDPPVSTVHVGALHSGDALNLVPDRATLDYEVRMLPSESGGALKARVRERVDARRALLRAAAPEGDIIAEPLADYPALSPDQPESLVALAREWAADDAPPSTLGFGTEAGLYAAAGIPTIVCGPGDIARAHKADEWIGMDELAAAGAMMERMTAGLMTGALSRRNR